MGRVLVVVRPFGRRKIGDLIEEPAQMAECLVGEQRSNVVATHIAATIAHTSQEH